MGHQEEGRGAAVNERFVALAITAIGATFAVLGVFEYGFWRSNGPGAGFFPTVFGVGAALCGLLRAFRASGRAEPVGVAAFRPLFVIVAAIAIAWLVGLALALSLAVAGWMRFVGGEKSWLSLTVAAVFFLFIYFVFWRWLGVNLDFGLAGRALAPEV